ncbi:MAG: hypothetical protein IJ493_09730 [Clostridia bacterium]|nr:hypothetical protein [Clostridia bacterium]
MEIPAYAARVVGRLEKAGYEAWCVGGCVRDTLMGRVPNDWDVTTSALPEQTLALFDGVFCADGEKPFKAVPTGIAHGTVTVLSCGQPVEVTTYRVDGEYTDCRRPDSVSFTSSLTEDLVRRDFTINAMAYSPTAGLRDPYGGADDLAAGIIRCVGDPVKRFSEDALRILRALRFASVLGFTIDDATADALLALRGLLDKISRERVSAELAKLLCGRDAAAVLSRFTPVLTQILPGAVVDVPLLTRLHGEPLTTLLAALSADGSDLLRLRFDSRTCSRVALLARERNRPLSCKLDVKCLCRDIGHDAARELMRLRGDRKAESWLLEILADGDCVSIAQLAVGGREMLSLGIPSNKIGNVLDALLNAVMEGRVPNEKSALEEFAATL